MEALCDGTLKSDPDLICIFVWQDYFFKYRLLAHAPSYMQTLQPNLHSKFYLVIFAINAFI
jgi:hypothetical protein